MIPVIFDSKYSFMVSPRHFRITHGNKKLPYGGYTVLTVFSNDGKVIDVAYSRCSNKDRYSRKEGIKWAVRHLVLRKFKKESEVEYKVIDGKPEIRVSLK